MRVRWLTAFLDFPSASLARGVQFWQAVTGYGLSPWRGEQDEFATLLPADGGDYLRVQDIGPDAPRIHVDLHVDDIAGFADDARRLGATDVTGGVATTLRSPGGFVFCVVDHATPEQPPLPAAWPPAGHRSRVDQVCLDIPPRSYDREIAFWAELASWERTGDHDDEFERLTGVGALRVLVQRLHDDAPSVSAHLDLASDDMDAEVARHRALGATYRHTGRGWITLADPTGLVYCVTGRTPS
jgi:hypothetical protein